MAEIKYKYWSGAKEFIDADAKRLLQEMFAYDEGVRNELPYNIKFALKSLDKAIVQFMVVLQKFYQNKEKWEDAQNTRAAVAMANSALNYHLLARHAVLLGYATETEPLYRACFERMTRCAVFQLEEKLSKKFWEGKEIHQKQIGELISKHFENKTKGIGEIAHRSIKDMYKQLSQISHPNSEALKFRTVKLTAKEEGSLGIDFLYCGENQEILRLASIGECLNYLIFSLFMFEIVSRKVFGTWASVLERRIEGLFKENEILFAHIDKSTK